MAHRKTEIINKLKESLVYTDEAGQSVQKATDPDNRQTAPAYASAAETFLEETEGAIREAIGMLESYNVKTGKDG